MKPANVKMFSDELSALNWESKFRENSPSLAFEKFNTPLLGIYDLICPLKSMKIRKKAVRKPWVDDELLRMIDIRNALYTAHINEPNDFSFAQFKDQRNLVNSTRRKKMRNFYGNKFKKNASNPKATWKITNEVIRGSPAPQKYSLNFGGEIVRDLNKVCDLFAYHFSKIGETVQSEAAVNNELLIEESTFYDLRGCRWRVKDLTYRISRYPSKLKKLDVDIEIARAFNLWTKATQLNFFKRETGGVHIEIRFESYKHGDGYPFDGPGSTLAHADVPINGGDVHFDDTETWTINSYKGSQYWRFDPSQRPPIESGYPKNISDWESLPVNMQSAFQYINGYTYFFKNGEYWGLNGRSFK
ncbi:hypothetical protein QYM36_005209, partial [Artemia franciscana]